MPAHITLVDLFAGIGGFSLGFLKSNEKNDFRYDIKLLADVDSSASYTFKKNYPTIPYWIADLSSQDARRICQLINLPAGELDLLIGGPPCQGFSSNGKRWVQDSRNGLLLHFIKLALEVKPKCILIENVPLVLFAFEKAFEREIENSFKGYDVQVKILNASAFGVPQIRKRAFIVAFREDLKVSEPFFPESTHIAIENGPDALKKSKALMSFINIEDAISDLPSLRPGGKVDGEPYTLPPGSEYQRQRRKGSIAIFNHIARAHSKDFIKKLSVIKPGRSNLELPDNQKFSENYYSQAYGRLHKKGIAFTLTANFRNPGSGRFMHYRDKRSITVREAARIQSFDDKFIFHGFDSDQERHVGNAVPPLLAEAFAKHIGPILVKRK